MKHVAIILAGGSGTRFGSDLPKQYIEVGGKTILERTVEVFEAHPRIDEICVVLNKRFTRVARTLLRKYPKVKNIVAGGDERYKSSLAGIRLYEDDDLILTHDAVRPLVSPKIISDILDALSEYDAVDTAIPMADTPLEVGDNGLFVADFPPRKKLRAGQTPQGFKCKVIREALEQAIRDPNVYLTDDCGAIFKYKPEVKVFVVEGDKKNIKITHPEDVSLMKVLLDSPN